MITLDALGKLDDFGKVFDLDHYRANRNALVASVKARADAGSNWTKKLSLSFRQAVLDKPKERLIHVRNCRNTWP